MASTYSFLLVCLVVLRRATRFFFLSVVLHTINMCKVVRANEFTVKLCCFISVKKDYLQHLLKEAVALLKKHLKVFQNAQK